MCCGKDIEVIGRAVCISNGNLLLCHSKGVPHTYLPGGHVEFEERAADSLARELSEELGLKGKVGRFLGAVEHAYSRAGERCCEINLVFSVSLAGLNAPAAPKSMEDYIEFQWVRMADLAKCNLEPYPLRSVIPGWLSADGGVEAWASTM